MGSSFWGETGDARLLKQANQCVEQIQFRYVNGREPEQVIEKAKRIVNNRTGLQAGCRSLSQPSDLTQATGTGARTDWAPKDIPPNTGRYAVAKSARTCLTPRQKVVPLRFPGLHQQMTYCREWDETPRLTEDVSNTCTSKPSPLEQDVPEAVEHCSDWRNRISGLPTGWRKGQPVCSGSRNRI